MYRVGIGQKVRNVKIGENAYKNFYENEDLPADYEPHESYISQGIVIKIKKGAK